MNEREEADWRRRQTTNRKPGGGYTPLRTPGRTNPVSPGPEQTNTRAGSTTNRGGGRGGGGGGGRGGGGTSSAEAQRNKERAAAGKRSLDQAAALEAQVAAIRWALDHGYKGALDQNLADVAMGLEQQYNILKGGHSQRAQSLLEAFDATEKATAGVAEDAFSNLVRERQDTMSAILEQGAGETDALRAMVAAARNFQANTREGNRAYYDSLQSVNQNVTDLNLDTQTALAGAQTSAENERERLWQDFYNRRSESLTQLGNIRGQQREYYATAREYDAATPNEASHKKESEDAFMQAAQEAGKSYTRAALPEWISKFTGASKLQGGLNNSDLAAATQFEAPRKAQGSKLRSWR